MAPRPRAVLLVIDGLGVGAMPDGDEADRGSHTLRSVQEHAGPLRLPNLLALGLGDVAGVAGLEPCGARSGGGRGRLELRHPGADTYMGHQELMGARMGEMRLRLMADLAGDVRGALRVAGHRTAALEDGLSPLLVDGCVVVADAIEARPGLNLNVTGSLDDRPFEELEAIGQVVRDAVDSARIVVVSGPGFGLEDMRANLRVLPSGQVGVDCAALGVYDEHYRVRHLGRELDVAGQLPARARSAGHAVALIGKAADVIACADADADPVVRTDAVLERLHATLADDGPSLIVANVQETDLAGHEQDAAKYGEVLERVDAFLPRLLGELRPGDRLLICGDHGNDPAIGHGQHTRERTPILVAGPDLAPAELGTRSSLADVGATMAEILGVGPLASGSSFEQALQRVP